MCCSNMDKIFENRIKELSDRAYYGSYSVCSDFLNLEQKSSVLSMDLPSGCTFYGGYEGAERVVAVFGEVYDISFENFEISLLKVSPVNSKFSDNLTHRDFLGTLMGLGIERKLIGDILVSGNTGYIFCLEKIADFISDELKRVKHTSVICERIFKLPDLVIPKGEIEELVVSSLRADTVVSGVYKMSRNVSAKLFSAEKVFVNSVMIENTSYTLSDGDIVSVRGYGRFVFNCKIRTTKKDRLVIEISRFS